MELLGLFLAIDGEGIEDFDEDTDESFDENPAINPELIINCAKLLFRYRDNDLVKAHINKK